MKSKPFAIACILGAIASAIVFSIVSLFAGVGDGATVGITRPLAAALYTPTLYLILLFICSLNRVRGYALQILRSVCATLLAGFTIILVCTGSAGSIFAAPFIVMWIVAERIIFQKEATSPPQTRTL